MISFLQKVLQKHHKWLFSILLVIVTISFVFTVGSSPGIGRNTRGQKKKVFGCDLTSQREIARWMQEIELSSQLKGVFVGLPQLKEYAFFVRLASLRIADELGIPAPRKNNFDEYVKELPEFQDDEKIFSIEKYNEFVDSLSKDPAQKKAFERTIINDFRIDTVQKLLAGPGYSIDPEVKLSVRIDEAKYSYLRACFHRDGIPKIDQYSENDLRQHLDLHREDYKIDEQVVLEYVEFPNNLFTGKIPYPTESEILSFYNKNRPEIKDLEKNSEPWKAAVAEAYRNDRARRMAMTAADQFTYQLYEGNVASYSAEFFKLLDERNVFLKELEPITMGQFSGHPRFSSGALEQAAESKNGRYYSDPVISKMDTVCVLIHKKIIPAIYPPFEEIKERVKQDYLQKQTREFLFHKVESVRMQLIIPNQTIGEQFITLAKENNGVVTEFKSIEIKPDDRDPIHEIVRSLPLRQISAVITKNEKEKELLLVLAKEIPPTANEEKVLIRKKELEELNKSLFRDYLSELILHELGIKSNQDPIAQQMKIVAPLYYMQIENTIRR